MLSKYGLQVYLSITRDQLRVTSILHHTPGVPKLWSSSRYGEYVGRTRPKNRGFRTLKHLIFLCVFSKSQQINKSKGFFFGYETGKTF